MKLVNILISFLLIAWISIFMVGCEDFKKNLKHTQSSWTGLERKVTLYSASGEIIKTWSGKFKIEENSAALSFITDEGKEVKIMGTIIVEEQ